MEKLSGMAEEELKSKVKGMAEEEKAVVLSLFSLKDLAAEICARAAQYEVQISKVKEVGPNAVACLSCSTSGNRLSVTAIT